ncbi:uncharacterized protein LOC135387690 [Ornithodoros turicata]|uniref:uncharacterized protein LOC135387690 n=1 Tax=Ornithodoros turicata TaxID=34597 RepID=UPI0031392E7D
MDKEKGVKTYVVVKFPDEEDSVAMIHGSWMVDGGRCMWPNEKDTGKLKHSIMRGTVPQHHWSKHRCVVLSSFDTYEEAHTKLKKAEMTSDLASDTELGRGKRKKRRTNRGSPHDHDEVQFHDSWTTDSEECGYAPPRPPTPPTYFDLSHQVNRRQSTEVQSVPETQGNHEHVALGRTYPFPRWTEAQGREPPPIEVPSASTTPHTWVQPVQYLPQSADPSPPGLVQDSRCQSSQLMSTDCRPQQLSRFPGVTHPQLQCTSPLQSIGADFVRSISAPTTSLRHDLNVDYRRETARREQQSCHAPRRGSDHEGNNRCDYPSNSPGHAFEKEVLKILHILKVTQQSQSEQLSTILQRFSTMDDASEQQICLDRPFQTLADFLEFEDDLAENPAKRAQLKRYFKSIGGSTTRESVFRILSRLLHYKVGREYSLYGSKGKRRFSDLTTWKIMQNHLTESHGTPGPATLKEVEQATMSWLRHAPQAHDRQKQKEGQECSRQEP